LYEQVNGEWVPYTLKADAGVENKILIEGACQPKLYDIIPGWNLYLGSQDAALNVPGLTEKNCSCILNVATGIANAFPEKYKYLSVPILDTDNSDITKAFSKCFEFIDASREAGGLLVHCNAGVSRSASIVIAYIMSKKKIGFKEAFAIVKAAKPDICPNPGFVKQLNKYEKELLVL